MSDSTSRRGPAFAAAVLLAVAGVAAVAPGCAGGGSAETASPVPPPTTPAANAAADAAAVEAPEASTGTAADAIRIEPTPARPPSSAAPPDEIVILPGGREAAPGLVEAAAAERARKSAAAPSIAEVTDANLDTYGEGVVITRADPTTSDDAGRDGLAVADPAADPETYWRGRMSALRLAWRDVAEEIERLEREAGDLRRRFYAEDDPYVRDGRIKPMWDRTLDRLAEARAEAERLQTEVAAAAEEGRRAGALPGWLREGAALEPLPPRAEPERAEPAEPTVVDEPPTR